MGLLAKSIGNRTRAQSLPRKRCRGGSRHLGSGRGMTLVEVLVAMTVLLIGIWGIVHGFPALFRNLATERQRTQMVKIAEQRLSALAEQGQPDAITGGPAIPPDSLPDDPSDPATPPNARDDYLYVLGETFKVPSPALPPGNPANPPPSIYAFAQGLCEGVPATYVEVYQIVPLTALSYDPGNAPAGTFYLRKDGVIVPPPGIDAMIISYCWVDNALNIHYTNKELVNPAVPFVGAPSPWSVSAAARPDFHTTGGNGDGIVQDSAAGWGLVRFPVMFDPGGPALAPPPGTCWIESGFGAYLKFNAADAGKNMLVNYRLRTDRDLGGVPTRRSLIMVEDHLISASEATNISGGMGDVVIKLGADAIEPRNILGDPRTPAPQANGAGDTSAVHLLAIDLSTGDIFYNDATTVLLSDPNDPKFGYNNGKVKLHVQLFDTQVSPGVWVWGVAGHTFRFIYRTPDQHTVQIQKAPAVFVEAGTAAVYPPSRQGEVNFRAYVVGNNGPYTVLSFPLAAAGQTVAVDYLFNPADPTLVTGEVHTIPHETQTITLDRPNVVAVKLVRGVDMRARASWLSETGKLKVVDVDTLLPLVSF